MLKIIEKSISKEQNTVKEVKCLLFEYDATIQNEKDDERYLDRIFYESIKQKENPEKENPEKEKKKKK